MHLQIQALRFAEDIGFLSKLLKDFTSTTTARAIISTHDSIGVRHPTCSHSASSLDAGCLHSALVQCTGHPGGQDAYNPDIPPPPSDLDPACVEDNVGATKATEPARQALSALDGVPADPMTCSDAKGDDKCFKDPAHLEQATFCC